MKLDDAYRAAIARMNASAGPTHSHESLGIVFSDFDLTRAEVMPMALGRARAAIELLQSAESVLVAQQEGRTPTEFVTGVLAGLWAEALLTGLLREGRG